MFNTNKTTKTNSVNTIISTGVGVGMVAALASYSYERVTAGNLNRAVKKKMDLDIIEQELRLADGLADEKVSKKVQSKLSELLGGAQEDDEDDKNGGSRKSTKTSAPKGGLEAEISNTMQMLSVETQKAMELQASRDAAILNAFNEVGKGLKALTKEQKAKAKNMPAVADVDVKNPHKLLNAAIKSGDQDVINNLLKEIEKKTGKKVTMA